MGALGLSAGVHLVRKVSSDIRKLHQFANTNVLITGESGTGKELVARAIHYSSPRAEAPFLPVNCVAIPADLAESMFFGHLRGAFTGALSERKGWFELADGGTLFLDEIGDMPSGLQAKLLRVLEDGEITPVGASKSRRVDVRVVAATNADLKEKMTEGKFRQDFFFRLARYTVEMPSLRERPEDIPLLARHFLEVFAREMGIGGAALTPGAMENLMAYQFPGKCTRAQEHHRTRADSKRRRSDRVRPFASDARCAPACAGCAGSAGGQFRCPASQPGRGGTGAHSARPAAGKR